MAQGFNKVANTITLAHNEGIMRACGRDVESGAYFIEFDVEEPEMCAECGAVHTYGVMWLNMDGGEVYCLEHITFQRVPGPDSLSLTRSLPA